MKTTYSSGVIVTSQWLNGAQQIYFDGQDIDWHYPPLGLSSMVTAGAGGLDGRYITLSTDQPVLNSSGLYISGTPVTGNKVVSGLWSFGYDPLVAGNPANTIANAPKSYTTNSKYENANGIASPTISQKFAALAAEDIVTKEVLEDQISNLLDSLEIDNGIYYSSSNPACENYVGGSDVICPS
jgi:hypothetical protein